VPPNILTLIEYALDTRPPRRWPASSMLALVHMLDTLTPEMKNASCPGLIKFPKKIMCISTILYPISFPITSE